MWWSEARSARDKVVLPAPEGEDITRRRPRLTITVLGFPLFNVLHLLTHLVDDRLQLQAHGRQASIGSLGAQGVRLAIEFLREEIELTPGRLVRLNELAGRADMGEEPVDL